jgi:hypothetical protein
LCDEFVAEIWTIIAESDRDSSKTTETEGRFGMMEGLTERTLTDSITEMGTLEQSSPSHTGTAAKPVLSNDTKHMRWLLLLLTVVKSDPHERLFDGRRTMTCKNVPLV